MADDLGHLTEQIKSVANDNKRVSEESVTSFKQAANDNTQSMANFAKDLNSYFSKQKNDLQNLTDAIETSVTETENVARKIDNTNQLLQNSINIQRQMLGELTSVSGTLNDLLTEEKGKKEGGNSLLGDAVSSLGALGAKEALKKIGGRLAAVAAAGLAVELAPVLATGAAVVAGLAAITSIGYFIYYKLTQSQEELEALKRQERENAKNKGMGGNTADNPKSESPNKYRDNEFWTGKNYTLDDKGNNVPETNQKNETGSISKISLNHKSNGTYSASSAAQLASQAGATPEEAKTLGAIAMAESSGNPNSHNTKGRDNSYGLWQINLYGKLAGRVKEFGLQSPDDLFDPQNNAKAAVKILRQKGFNAWSKYSNGEYKKYLNQSDNFSTQEISSENKQIRKQSAAPFSVIPKNSDNNMSNEKGGDASKIASSMIGKSRQDSLSFLSKGGFDNKGEAWCAEFVNSSLKQTGISGTGSAVANSFQNWGTPVNPEQVKSGDVVLLTRGKGPNQTGGHVGIATGVYENGKVEMIAGNTSGKVKKYFVPVDGKTMIRRGGGADNKNFNNSEIPGAVDSKSNSLQQDITTNTPSRLSDSPMASIGNLLGGVLGGKRGAALGGLAGNILSVISSPAPGPIPQPRPMNAQQSSTPTQMTAAPSINPKSQSAINREGIPEHTKNSSPDWAHEIAGLAPRFATRYSQIS